MEVTGDVWSNLINGFSVVLTPQHLFFVFLGVTIGTVSACCRASVLR